MIKDVTPEQTRGAIQGGNGTVYLDVRTVTEFEQGHVPGSLNIPVLTQGADGMMKVNDAFPHVVSANIPRDSRVIVGCKSGQRSLQAADVLSRMGYGDVANMLGGFCGRAGFMGQVADEGWLGKGYPIAQEAEAGKSYAELLAKTSA